MRLADITVGAPLKPCEVAVLAGAQYALATADSVSDGLDALIVAPTQSRLLCTVGIGDLHACALRATLSRSVGG